MGCFRKSFKQVLGVLFFHDVGLLLYVKGDFDIGFVKNGGVALMVLGFLTRRGKKFAVVKKVLLNKCYFGGCF